MWMMLSIGGVMWMLLPFSASGGVMKEILFSSVSAGVMDMGGAISFEDLKKDFDSLLSFDIFKLQ